MCVVDVLVGQRGGRFGCSRSVKLPLSITGQRDLITSRDRGMVLDREAIVRYTNDVPVDARGSVKGGEGIRVSHLLRDVTEDDVEAHLEAFFALVVSRSSLRALAQDAISSLRVMLVLQARSGGSFTYQREVEIRRLFSPAHRWTINISSRVGARLNLPRT